MWPFIFGTVFNCSCSFLPVFLRHSRLFRDSGDADVDIFSQGVRHTQLMIIRDTVWNNCLQYLVVHTCSKGENLMWFRDIVGTGADTRTRLADFPHKKSWNPSHSGSGGCNHSSVSLHNMKVRFWLCKQWCKRRKNNLSLFTQSLCSFTEIESLLDSRFKLFCYMFMSIWKHQL